MIIYIASDGQARLVSPQHVYQGSNVTDITVIAPFPAQTAMTVAFSLPDGKMFGGVQGTMQTPPYLMTPLANQPELPDGVQAWQYVMPRAITQNAGQAKVSVTAQFAQGSEEATSFTQQTSAQVEFTIESSVVGKLPDEPTEDVWKQVLSYISAQDTKIAAIQSDVADIEQVADEANTNAGAAMDTANEANTTATQAKDTADGLADSIAQANVTASQAEQTAQEAKEIAEGVAQSNGTSVSVGGAFQQTLSFASDPQAQITANKNAIAEAQTDISDIVDGSQTVGKATTADSATNATNAANATKATQDANGNVIDTTYAKLSQVVRFDAKQSITPEQAQQVLENLGQNTSNDSTMSRILATYSFGTGYSTYVKLGTFYVGASNIEIDINAGLGAENTSGKIILVFLNGTLLRAEGRWDQKSSNITFWYDVRDIEGNYGYIDLYCNNVPYGKIYCTVRGTGARLIEKATNVSGLPSTNVPLPNSYRFITDPSKLAPSTANGWTQTTATGTLPSVGVYMIAVHHTPSATQPHHYYNPAILVYDGTAGSCTATDETGALLISINVTPSGIRLVKPGDITAPVQSTNIYYKRIA